MIKKYELETIYIEHYFLYINDIMMSTFLCSGGRIAL